jgi:hypothetical protein
MDPYFRIVSKSTKRHYWQRITTNFHVHANPALYFQHFPYRTMERESYYVLYLGVGHGRVLWFSMPNAWVFINHMKWYIGRIRCLRKFHTMFSHTANQKPNAVAIVISICCCQFLVLKTSVRVVWFVYVWKNSVRMGPPKNEWFEIMISFRFHTLHCTNQLWTFHEPIVGVSWSFCGMGRFYHLSGWWKGMRCRCSVCEPFGFRLPSNILNKRDGYRGFWKSMRCWSVLFFWYFALLNAKQCRVPPLNAAHPDHDACQTCAGLKCLDLLQHKKKMCVPIPTTCSLSHYPRLIIFFCARILNLDIYRLNWNCTLFVLHLALYWMKQGQTSGNNVWMLNEFKSVQTCRFKPFKSLANSCVRPGPLSARSARSARSAFAKVAFRQRWFTTQKTYAFTFG